MDYNFIKLYSIPSLVILRNILRFKEVNVELKGNQTI